MGDKNSFFDNIGTGKGIETVGDVMRKKERTKQAVKHERIMIFLTLAILIIGIITLIIVIVK